MNIYLDMDDVVADWIAHAQNFLKLRWDDKKGERIPQSDWDRLKADTHFYRSLPLKEGANDLVNYCRDLTMKTGGSLRFLTALPHDYSMPFAVSDKVFWAQEHFRDIPVTIGPFSYDKWRHCKFPTDILIDDRHSNCHEWIAAGGIAHIYTDWPTCRAWFQELTK
jgi:5' nucleotidase, deoxy (Pyrimidine), cytosolic type C protein (NT5C)